MFFGEYDHAIDEKSRLTLPARFREALGSGVVIAKGIDTNLDVYPRDAWTTVVQERLAGLDPFSRETRELQRFFFSGVVDAIPDKQGRVLVPPKLAERAGLEREVVVVGVYDHLEIWERGAWAEHLHAVEGRVDDVAERLAEKRS
jgi:transcriptional regulator MraZ